MQAGSETNASNDGAMVSTNKTRNGLPNEKTKTERRGSTHQTMADTHEANAGMPMTEEAVLDYWKEEDTKPKRKGKKAAAAPAAAPPER